MYPIYFFIYFFIYGYIILKISFFVSQSTILNFYAWNKNIYIFTIICY